MPNDLHCALVTGGTGFIGRRLVDRLLASHGKVRVLGRRPVVRWRSDPRVEHIRADISEPGVVQASLEGISTVYHLAAATDGDADYYNRVTVRASECLLASMAAMGGGRVIFVSSLSVYDSLAMRDGCVVDETFQLERKPGERGLYARAKIEAEDVARSYLSHSQVRVTIARPGLVYGPGTKNVLNGAAIVVRGRLLITTGNPKKRLPLIFVDDLAEALIALAAKPEAAGNIYNVIGPDMPTVSDFMRSYREHSGDARPVIDVPVRRLIPMLRGADGAASMIGRRLNLAKVASRLASGATFSGERLGRDLQIELQVGWREGLRRIYSR